MISQSSLVADERRETPHLIEAVVGVGEWRAGCVISVVEPGRKRVWSASSPSDI
jgi:hypothetical protein